MTSGDPFGLEDVPIDLDFEGTVYVEPPPLPNLVDASPYTELVVPTPGPQGRPGAAGAGFVHTQSDPSTVWTVEHRLNRNGPVGVVVTSLDYETTWENVLVQRVSADVVRLTFDDPTSGHALIQ